MSFLMRTVAHCDICGHEWLTAKVPSHCAKCKSRRWNQGGTPSKTLPAIIERWADGFAGLALAGHNPKTCRTYKCGMCAAIKAGSP